MAIIPFVRLSGDVAERDKEGVYVKYSENPKRWDFLNQQAQYMADCGYPFVEILGMAHGRYWMREYGSLFAVNHADLLWKAKMSLHDLWNIGKPRFVDGANWINAHRARVHELCEINKISTGHERDLAHLFEKNVVENAHRLTVCGATHGDATLSNIVMDKDQSIRWIDPIPPSLWLPAFKAVDLGKLLQSSHGWEHAMKNFDAPEHCDDVVFQDENVVDMMAADYFHALCYLRILRYAERGSLPHDYAINKLHELLNRR